nr:MAG TPA: homing endonuclease [Caudoviricetes sp.]
MVNVKNDLTGRQFGRLTVLKQAEDYIDSKGKHYARWLCECSCEDKTKLIVMGNQLKRKRTKSCGCIQKEQLIKRNKDGKKYNTYDLSGEYGIGYTSKGEEFYFDLEDYDKIKDYYWNINNQGYVVSSESDTRKYIRIHRLILGNPDAKYDVDHKHGYESRNDNRKSNLRLATRSQNIINVGLKSNNTSGCTGVGWYKHLNKWVARITVNGNKIHLGVFNNFDDAVAARKAAEEKYFGEWSYDNSMSDIKLNN